MMEKNQIHLIILSQSSECCGEDYSVNIALVLVWFPDKFMQRQKRSLPPV